MSRGAVMKGENMVRRVVCPGSFDPVTNGHLDIISRAASLHDEVVVAVGANLAKDGLFSVDERLAMLGEVLVGYANVRLGKFDGLLVDFCRAHDISAIVKGLRAVSDFEYEMTMAQMNYSLAGIETPLSSGAIMISTAFDYLDPGKELEELGITPRPLSKTVADSIKWYRKICYC